MNQDAGKINLVFAADTSDVEQGAERIETLLNQTGESAEVAGKRIDNAFKQEAISAREMNEVIDVQNKVVSELRDAYERAKQAASDAFGGDDAKYRELIDAQEKLKKEYDDESDALRRLNQQREAMNTSGDAEENLRTRLRAATQELASLTLKYREMSDEERASAQGQELKKKLDELTKKAGNLRDAMDDANRAIRGTASDTQNFDALAGGLNVITSSAGAAQGALSMLGINQEALMDIQTKLQASLAISNALSVIQNNLQKESAMMLGIRRIQERAAATAIAIRTAAEGKGTIATKAATAAQAAFNLVAKANPYVLLATVLLGVVAALVGFTRKTKEATEAEKKQQEELENQRKAAEEWKKSISDSAAQVATQYRLLQEQYTKLKTEHEKKKWIDENKSAFSKLGVAVNNVTDAEKVFVQNTAKMMDAFKKRAEAAAYQTKLTEAYSRLISRREQLDEERTRLGQGVNVRQAGQQIAGEDVSRYGLQEGVDYTHKSGKVGMFFTEAGAAKVNRGMQERRTEENDPEMQKINSEINGYVDKITELQQGIEADLAGLTTSVTKSVDKDKKALADALARAKQAYAQALADAQKAKEDAEVQATEDDSERALKQLALNHKRKLDEINREEWELLERKKASEGADATLTEAETKIFEERRNAENRIYNNAIAQRAKAAADHEKSDMEEYLITYGTFQQRVTTIHAKYARLRERAETEGARLSLAAQEEAEIEALNERFGYATKAMADLFADASKKSVSEIQKIITKYETLIKYMEGQKAVNTGGTAPSEPVTTQDLKGLGFTDADIKRIERGEINVKDLTDAIKQLKGELGERSPWLTFQKDIKDSIQKLKEGDLAGGVSGIGDAVTQFTPALKEFGDTLGDAFGSDTDDMDSVMELVGGIGQAAQATGQFMSGDFVGGAMAAVGAIGSIVGAITQLIDAKHERRIKKLQENIDELDRAYDDLERAVSHTYSFIKQNNINLEIESKQQQISLIKQQIQEERDKKKTDDDRIKEWEDKIHSLEQEIIDLRDAAVDAIFGESVQNAIENFANAYAEAWAQGEDKAVSAKDTVKKMMRQMVIESIKAAIDSQKAMERIRQKLQEFYADNVLSPWEQDYVMNMAEQLQRQLDAQYGWADGLFAPDKSTSQDSTKRGFETMTQDQASELNGRFTGIQMETAMIDKKLDTVLENNAAMRANMASVAEGMSQMVELQGVAVSHLAQIEKNTNELPEHTELLRKIERKTRNL